MSRAERKRKHAEAVKNEVRLFFINMQGYMEKHGKDKGDEAWEFARNQLTRRADSETITIQVLEDTVLDINARVKKHRSP